MRKIILFALSVVLSFQALAATNQYAVYVVNATSIMAVANTGKSVAILNGNNNMVLAPVSVNGTSVAVLGTPGGACYSCSSSRCPNYCDINSIATAIGGTTPAQTSYSNVYTDLNNYPKTNNNCVVINSSFISSLTSSVNTVVVMVWTSASGKSQVVYVCCDNNNAAISGMTYTDNGGIVTLVTLPKA